MHVAFYVLELQCFSFLALSTITLLPIVSRLSIEQETHQVVVTPVIVNRPSSVNLDGHPKVGLARQSEVSRDDGGQNQRWGGKPAGVFAAEYRQVRL